MIGLDYLVAGYFHLAAADTLCKARKTPEVSVIAKNSNVRYDHSRSQAELEQLKTDTISPYGADVQTHVGGLMSGEVRTAHNIRFVQEHFPRQHRACVYIDKIDVTIEIRPTIFIANEYPKTGCMYRAIMEHEKKHVAVDREIISKYKVQISRAVKEELARGQNVYGPVDIRSVGGKQEEIQARVTGVIKTLSANMGVERRKRQQAVDTLEEYERVKAKCKGRT